MEEIRHLIPSRKPGVPEEAVADAERRLGLLLPQQFRDLVKLTNKPEIGEWLCYPIRDPRDVKRTWDDIVRNNRDPGGRWERLPRDLISFAEDGTGDLLCFRAEDGKLQDRVYLWLHETGQVEEYAPDLRSLILRSGEE